MRTNIHRILLVISYLYLLASLSGCSSSWTLFPTKISSQILASSDTNPDANGRASPVVIRIYELSSIKAFQDADFFKLFDEEEATLGGDLLSRDEFELSPGQGREIFHRPHEEARYFGVLVAYRDIDKAHWRASTPLELNSKNYLIVTVGKQTVKIHRR